MEFINETFKTKIEGDYDLIIVGGGPAGIGAAVSAGRNGLKTLIIEQYGFFGGAWTAALVNPFFDTENKGGIVKELVDDLKKTDDFGAFWNISFNFETMKKLLDEKIKEAGVDILFHTTFSSPIKEGNRIKGVVVQNKAGRAAYTAKYVLDCTGDGDVAYMAGADFVYGNENNGKAQSMTTMFLLSGVKLRQNKPNELYDLMKKAVDTYDTGYNIEFDKPFAIWLPMKDIAVVQLVHVQNHNGTDPVSLSNAEISGRKKVYETFEFFKKYIPEFKNAELIMTAPQIGVRETRHIVGDFTLTKEHILNGTNFEDNLGFEVAFNVDIHDDSEKQNCFSVKKYQIPLRALIVKGFDGLLTAGRCISGDFVSHASYRVTGNCVAMGEGAAVAIAKAIKENKDIRKINKVF